MGKGATYERKLSNAFEAAEWGVLRTGGSGAGTSDDRPDVVAGDGETLLVIEAKFASSRNIYLEGQEIRQITNLAAAFGGTAAIFPRWNTRKVDAIDTADWFVVSPHHIPQTDGGRYALNCEKIAEEFPTMSEIV